MEDKCQYEYFKTATDKCEFAKTACVDDLDVFNFVAMHYCAFDEQYLLTVPIIIAIIYICFFMLSDTSNKYLSIALTILTEKLNISQNLAGVTLLAFGNGAPDVIASFVASGKSDDGIAFSIAALTGGGVFVTGMVLSSVVYFATSVKVNRILFSRDIVVYIISLIVLVLFGVSGSISLLESIFFLMIYIIYVISAVILDLKWKPKIANEDEKVVSILEDIEISERVSEHSEDHHLYNILI